MKDDFEYHVAFSFAGEDRKYVEQVANYLKSKNVNVFYDAFEEVKLWGKDLYEYLDSIYKEKAKYCVIFISKFYAEKLWTNHERKSAQERAFRQNEEYILPARFDETEIPGIRSTVSYVDLSKLSPEEFADKILKKLDFTITSGDTHESKNISYSFYLLPNPRFRMNFGDIKAAIKNCTLEYIIRKDYGNTNIWPGAIEYGTSDKTENGLMYKIEYSPSSDCSYFDSFGFFKDGGILFIREENYKQIQNQVFELMSFLENLISFFFFACNWFPYFKYPWEESNFSIKINIPYGCRLGAGMNMVENGEFISTFDNKNEIEEYFVLLKFACNNFEIFAGLIEQISNTVVTEFSFTQNNRVNFPRIEPSTVHYLIKRLHGKLKNKELFNKF